MSRAQLVQFLHSINVFTFGAFGLGFLFATSSMVPNLDSPSTGVARSGGAIGLVFALLLSSLGPKHHGAYCLTMTLHFILMAVNVIQTTDNKLPNGALDPSVAFTAVFNGTMFVIMLGLLMNGGIGHETTEKKGH